jgi:hypothetical protein
MSELEDLSAKAARLWLKLFRAQAKAATDAARNLPEVTRSLADAGVPLAAEVKRWMEGALPAAGGPAGVPAQPVADQQKASTPAPPVLSAAAQESAARPLTRCKYRRVRTMQRSLSRRRARRA